MLFRQLGLPLPSLGFSIMEQVLDRYNAGSSGFSVNKAIDLAMDQCQMIRCFASYTFNPEIQKRV